MSNLVSLSYPLVIEKRQEPVVLPLSWETLQNYKVDPYKYTGNLRGRNETQIHDEMLMNKSLSERTKFMLRRLEFIVPRSRSSHGYFRVYNLINNEYPYSVERGIKHMVLFINPVFEKYYRDEEIIDNIVRMKATEYGYDDYLFLEQPDERKSLPTILHYHVFFRNTGVYPASAGPPQDPRKIKSVL